jgi:hypothetical protein
MLIAVFSWDDIADFIPNYGTNTGGCAIMRAKSLFIPVV